jgi:translation initiation factor IF-3
VLVIGADNTKLGVVPTDEAIRMAYDAGMDLVEVAPQERPPVCRIMDYGKWKYHQKKKQKKRGHEQQLKELRLRPKTDTNDRNIKMARARQFLSEGDKVQFTMIFRGRERFHQELGLGAFWEITQELAELAKVERPPKMEGRRMTMILAPLKAAPAGAAGKSSPDKAPADDASVVQPNAGR